MERVGDILASRRDAHLRRGPYDGADLPLPHGTTRPPYLCVGLVGEHYVLEPTMPGMYVYVGRCAEVSCPVPPGRVDHTRSGGYRWVR